MGAQFRKKVTRDDYGKVVYQLQFALANTLVTISKDLLKTKMESRRNVFGFTYVCNTKVRPKTLLKRAFTHSCFWIVPGCMSKAL